MRAAWCWPPASSPYLASSKEWVGPSGTRNTQLAIGNLYKKQNLPHDWHHPQAPSHPAF